MITVARITSSKQVKLEDVNALLPQLREGGGPLGTQGDLVAIVDDPNVVFVTVTDDAKTIGMATAYLATKFGKKTGFVEDVVVDEGYRGQGLGQKIMEVLIEEARKQGVTQLYLTSRLHRVPAHKLYEKLGFQKKDTQVFKLSL